jgi:hypothetical protein
MEIATPITAEMVEDAIQLLPPIEKEFRRLVGAAASAEASIREAQAAREEAAPLAHVAQELAIRREADQLAEVARVRHTIALVAKDAIDRSLPDGKVPLELATFFIMRTIWWHSHSSGSPVLASGHARRITGSDGDWRVKFGANSFLVGRAISRCYVTIRQYIDGVEAGKKVDPAFIVGILRLRIASSVAVTMDSSWEAIQSRMTT